jgi:hypothetical protein
MKFGTREGHTDRIKAQLTSRRGQRKTSHRKDEKGALIS